MSNSLIAEVIATDNVHLPPAVLGVVKEVGSGTAGTVEETGTSEVILK